MKVGTLGYATHQGLGLLIKDFYDHGVLNEMLVVKHYHHHTHKGWYPDADMICIRPFNRSRAREYVKKLDILFIFETPFDWMLIPYCREVNTKTVLMPMYECMPRKLPYWPDAIINPSELDQQYFPRGNFIPVPVEMPWRQRDKAEVFIHNAGHGGLRGRNGTKELLRAMQYVKSPIHLIVRSQKSADELGVKVEDDRVEFDHSDFPTREAMFEEGDVFIFPEKFNGLSLPLQEARASGMLVMTTDRFPMNTWLPQESLIPMNGTVRDRISGRCLQFDKAVIDPKAIAAKIDEWYGKDISEYSRSAQEWAQEMSWEALRPVYQEELERCLSEK